MSGRVDPKIVEAALARLHSQLKEAKPTAEACYKALMASEPLPDEIPEASDDLPDCYPYTMLPEHEARQLLFITTALPDKAAELQGLWLSRLT